MNFLDLCRDVARESGTLAGGVSLSTVTSAPGRAGKVVSWVRKAWIDIQNWRDEWEWMRRGFNAPLTAGTAVYTAVSFDLTRVGEWAHDRPGYRAFSIYDSDIGVRDEGAIRETDWDTFRSMYVRGYTDPGRPNCYVIDPAGALRFGPTPDKAYVVRGEYRLEPQILTVDEDIPEMPSRYHDLVVWQAMVSLAIADEAPQSEAAALRRIAPLRTMLMRDQLPRITLGGRPIA